MNPLFLSALLSAPARFCAFRHRYVSCLFFLLAVGGVGQACRAADAPAPNANRPLAAVHRPAEAKPPVLDGDLSDSIWLQAAKASVFYDPQTGKPAPDQTEAYLAYDKENIYVAFYCHDSQPDSIVARETVRNAELMNDDSVQLELDPFLTYKYNDNNMFAVNARGTQNTHLGGGRAGKLEWQGDWKVATKRVTDGWTAEMQIPWSILSYPRNKGVMTMGVNFRRRQQRTQISSMWSDLGPQFFNDREGLWKGVEAPNQTWKPRLSMLPYLMPSGYATGGNSQVRVGVDARYQPTPELVGVATINPDFASVEGAVEGVYFSRSERYVPDRRPFFLEGADFFQLGEGYQIGRLFDSAHIQAMDTGLKLYGKMNAQTTVGVLGTIGLNREANFVAQVRREFGPTSNARLMLMQRGAPGEDNTVLALAQQWRRGKFSTDGQLVQTFGQGAGGLGWTTAANLEDKNLFGTLRYLHVPGNFQDRLGLIPFNDYHGFSSYWDWGGQWRKGFFRNFELGFNPLWDWHLDGRPFRRRASLFASIETRSDYRFNLNLDGGKFDNDTDFTVGIGIFGGVTNRFRQWGLEFTTGRQAGRPYTSFGPSFKLRLFRRLDLLLSSYVQNFDGIEQQHILTFNYELSPYRSWGGRIVVQNGNVNPYLSYRASGRAGTDFYFIIGDPNATRFVKRVMVKLVFAIS